VCLFVTSLSIRSSVPPLPCASMCDRLTRLDVPCSAVVNGPACLVNLQQLFVQHLCNCAAWYSSSAPSTARCCCFYIAFCAEKTQSVSGKALLSALTIADFGVDKRSLVFPNSRGGPEITLYYRIYEGEILAPPCHVPPCVTG
jgi:hypothetical protein